MQITELKERHQKEQQRADEAIKVAEKLMTEYRKRK